MNAHQRLIHEDLVSFVAGLPRPWLHRLQQVQDIRSHVEQMKTAYTASGSIVVLDGQTLVIEPNMPAPVCALPREEDGKTAWSLYAFPLSSITVPLTEVDESVLSEDRVFTNPDAPKAYKPGDKGDAIMVVVVGMLWQRNSAP